MTDKGFDIGTYLAEQQAEVQNRKKPREVVTEASYEKPGKVSSIELPKRGRPRKDGGSGFTSNSTTVLPSNIFTHATPTPEQVLENKQQKQEEHGFLRQTKQQHIEVPSGPINEDKK